MIPQIVIDARLLEGLSRRGESHRTFWRAAFAIVGVAGLALDLAFHDGGWIGASFTTAWAVALLVLLALADPWKVSSRRSNLG